MVTFSKTTLVHACACTVGFLLLLSHVSGASLGFYDTDNETADRISKLIEREAYSQSMSGQTQLTEDCKNKGVGCEDDLMSLWMRQGKRALISHRMAGKRADLPVLCKKMGVACEDDLMGLWLRMMPDRHPVRV